MARKWKWDKDEKAMVNSETGQKLYLDNTKISRAYGWGKPGNDGISVNNPVKRGTVDELLDAYAMWKETGNPPTEAQLIALGATNKGARENILQDMKVLAAKEGLDFENYSAEQSNKSASDIETPFFSDPNKIMTPGTKENDMLELYKKSNETTRGLFEQENQQTQVDMMKELDNQRRQTLEEVRNRRRTMLKNGLSSAQIANEEVQSLMMNNSTNRMIADEYIRERGRVRNTFNQNQANAPFNVAEMFNSFNQQGAAFAAAKAGDPNHMAQLFRQSLDQQRYNENQYKSVQGIYED